MTKIIKLISVFYISFLILMSLTSAGQAETKGTDVSETGVIAYAIRD